MYGAAYSFGEDLPDEVGACGLPLVVLRAEGAAPLGVAEVAARTDGGDFEGAEDMST